MRHTLKMNLEGKYDFFFTILLLYFQVRFSMYGNRGQTGDSLQDDMLDIAYSRMILGSKKQTLWPSRKRN